MPTASPAVCGCVCGHRDMGMSSFYGAVSDRSRFRVIKFSKLEIKCFKYVHKRTRNLRFFMSLVLSEV